MGGNSTRKLRKSVNVEMTLAAKFYIPCISAKYNCWERDTTACLQWKGHNINTINFIHKERKPLKKNTEMMLYGCLLLLGLIIGSDKNTDTFY